MDNAMSAGSGSGGGAPLGEGGGGGGSAVRFDSRYGQQIRRDHGRSIAVAETPLDRRLRAIGGLLSVLTAGQDRLIAATTAATVGPEIADDAAKDASQIAATAGTADAEATDDSLTALPISASLEFSIPQKDDATPNEALSEASAPEGAEANPPSPALPTDLEDQAILVSDVSSNLIQDATCANLEKMPEKSVQEDEPVQEEEEEQQQHEAEAISTEPQGREAEATSESAPGDAATSLTGNAAAAVVDDNGGVRGGFSSIVGSLAAKDALLEAVVLPLRLGQLAGPGGVPLFSGLRQAGHVLLYGPPGTGKTSLAAAAVKQPRPHKTMHKHPLIRLSF